MIRTAFIDVNPEAERQLRIRLEVLYDFTPAEAETRTSPPMPPDVDIRRVFLHVGFMRICECTPLVEWFAGFGRIVKHILEE